METSAMNTSNETTIGAIVGAGIGPSTCGRRLRRSVREIASSVVLSKNTLEQLAHAESHIDDAGLPVRFTFLVGGRFVVNDVPLAVQWRIDGENWLKSPKCYRDGPTRVFWQHRVDGIAESVALALRPNEPALIFGRVCTLSGPFMLFAERFGQLDNGIVEWGRDHSLSRGFFCGGNAIA
jgi:hypothetical protein